MGIDRIGKGGSAPPPSNAERADRVKGVEPSKAFEVRPEPAPAEVAGASAVAPSATSPLERLRSGEIDLDRYLDLKVDEATRHLDGLRAPEKDAIRSILREQIAGDPMLVDLVQQATGRAPTPKDA